MSAEDVIGHIPGADQIAQGANQVLAANVDGIVKLKKGLQNAHDEAVATHQNLATELGELPKHWEGDDHNAFQGYMKTFTAVDKRAHALMKKGITGLDDAVKKLDEAKAQIQKDLNAMAQDYDDQLEAAKKKTDAHGNPVPVDTDALGQKVIAAHKKAIEADVKKYDQAMVEVAKDLNTALSSSGDGFDSIPSPGTSNTTPQSAPVNYDGGGATYGGGGGGGGAGGGGGGGFAAGVVAPDVHVSGDVQEWIDKARKILAEHGIHLSDSDLKALKLIIQHESGGNPNAINNWDCVPLDTMVLTRRDWLKHDEVRVGDQTIGYNRDTGRSEWTTITGVVHHQNAPLVRMHNSRWSVTTTPNHRWLTFPWVSVGIRAERQQHVCSETSEFVTTQGIDTRDRLLVAAPAETDSMLDITEQEAAILGWIAGDGHVETRRHAPSMSIAQSKPRFVTKLHELLAGIPHAVYVDDRGGCESRHQFRLDPGYAQGLLRRAGHPKSDAVAQVIAMSSAQRAAWLQAVVDAEANAVGVIYQAPGSVLDAATLATYLSGRRPRVGVVTREKVDETWAPERWLASNTPVVTGGFLSREPVPRADVWCVTTELGTWTAREEDNVFLTGNSNAAAGHPSQGLMQCIPSTFNAYALPGYDDNIKDPVSNIIAGVRYSISRYGSLSSVPGVEGVSSGSGYVGY